MSKSKGNVVAPSDVLKQFGGEILRLWVAMSDYQSDLKISQNILKQLSEQYRKIRNTLRFLLANTADLTEPCTELGPFDRWILLEASGCFHQVHAHFEQYEFARGFHLLGAFLSRELSGEYLEMCKDRLYCEAMDASRRRASQSVMAAIARSLLGLVAPVLTHTVDEVLEHASGPIRQGAKDVFSLHYQPIEEVTGGVNGALFQQAREEFQVLVDGWKKQKFIRNTLELALYTDSEEVLALEPVEIQDWFGVSELLQTESEGEVGRFSVGNDHFAVFLSQKFRCPRCWRHQSGQEEELCARCASVLEGQDA